MDFHASFMSHEYRGFEPLMAFDVVYGGNFEHRLTSTGAASMQHQRLALGDIKLESGLYDFPVIAAGHMPKDAYSISFIADGADITRYNTTSIDADEIQIFPVGAELLYHAIGPSRWINLIVPEDRLHNALYTRTTRHFDLGKTCGYTIKLTTGGRAALTALADDAFALARRLKPAGGMQPDLASTIYECLLGGYMDALAAAQHPRGQSSARAATGHRHHLLITACERMTLAGADAAVPLSEIARRSGYSLRSLELIFRRSVGMAPVRWFLTARLNGALRDLLTCGPSCSVSEVATKWGFQHMSRFSQYYRGAFGESPRDTLARPRLH